MNTCPGCPRNEAVTREECYDFVHKKENCLYKEKVPHQIVDQLSFTILEIYTTIINYEKEESLTTSLKNLCEKYLDEYYTFEQLKKESK